MKKTIFKTAIVFMVLSLIMSSCRQDPFDLNNPGRPSAPLPPTIETQGTVGSVTTLTVTSELADYFQWRRNGQLLSRDVTLTFDSEVITVTGERGETLTITSGTTFHHQAPHLTVAGVNESGTGNALEWAHAFFPWEVPSAATFTGASNVCPARVMRLTANNIPQATEIEWFFGRTADEVAERVFLGTPVAATGAIFDVRFGGVEGDIVTGFYAVRGRNELGAGPPAFSGELTWEYCGPHWFEGTWFGHARNLSEQAFQPAWEDEIRHSSDFPGIHDLDEFFTLRAFGNNDVRNGGRISIRVIGNDLWFRCGDTLEILPDGTYLTQHAIWWFPNFVFEVGEPPVGTWTWIGGADRQFQTNADRTAFRLPPGIGPFNFNALNPSLVGYFGGIAVIHNVGGLTSQVGGMLDVVYTRWNPDYGQSISGTSQGIEWIEPTTTTLPTDAVITPIRILEDGRIIEIR